MILCKFDYVYSFIDPYMDIGFSIYQLYLYESVYTIYSIKPGSYIMILYVHLFNQQQCNIIHVSIHYTGIGA